MLNKANFTDPWSRTLRLLSALSGETDASVSATLAAFERKGQLDRYLPVVGQRFEVQIRVIDRPSPSTATVAWRDPTHCSYGDQVWHACHARLSGVCALSGKGIKRGDAIYKPRPCRPAPVNAGAMILFAILNDAFASETKV
ncbi:hypothetical protein P3T18_001240 [Paraburkholderia sp. GAS199]|uniref:DUF3331 domain-containing protein n=1 Tax=Paraburkholderia sp. GAS199 TaxID=3035126 RepID=UPI003D24F35F